MVAADLSSDTACREFVQATLDAYGRIDSLVHAASVGYNWQEKSPGTMADVLNTTPDAWHEVLSINLDAYFYMCRRVIPHFLKQGKGNIVNVASISGYQGLAGAHTYTAAKGAVINLTRSLCVAYGCLYLASDKSSYCNGTVLTIDGGTTARQ